MHGLKRWSGPTFKYVFSVGALSCICISIQFYRNCNRYNRYMVKYRQQYSVEQDIQHKSIIFAKRYKKYGKKKSSSLVQKSVIDT